MPLRDDRKTIPQIERMRLPHSLPIDEAMKSWGHNETSYDPDLWGLEYATHCYLIGLTDDELRSRHSNIVKNLRSWTNSERDVVPIVSYQSSWYWFRKEHHIRLELAFRNIFLPLPSYDKMTAAQGLLRHPPIPNGDAVLFRYGKLQYMRELREQGRVRFVPAEAYQG